MSLNQVLSQTRGAAYTWPICGPNPVCVGVTVSTGAYVMRRWEQPTFQGAFGTILCEKGTQGRSPQGSDFVF